jgi:hypothetical protein
VFVWLLRNIRIEKGSEYWNLTCYDAFLFVFVFLVLFLEDENSPGLRMIFV